MTQHHQATTWARFDYSLFPQPAADKCHRSAHRRRGGRVAKAGRPSGSCAVRLPSGVAPRKLQLDLRAEVDIRDPVMESGSPSWISSKPQQRCFPGTLQFKRAAAAHGWNRSIDLQPGHSSEGKGMGTHALGFDRSRDGRSSGTAGSDEADPCCWELSPPVWEPSPPLWEPSPDLTEDDRMLLLRDATLPRRSFPGGATCAFSSPPWHRDVCMRT